MGHPANVAYLELDLPHSFPLHLRKFIPNIHFASAAQDGVRQIRVVALGAYSTSGLNIMHNTMVLGEKGKKVQGGKLKKELKKEKML